MNRHSRSLVLVLAAALSCAPAGCALTGACGSWECPDEAALRAAVEARLSQNPELQPPNMIQVMVRGHAVTLHGEVSTDYAQRLAGTVASEVPGVKKVVNLVALTYSGTR